MRHAVELRKSKHISRVDFFCDKPAKSVDGEIKMLFKLKIAGCRPESHDRTSLTRVADGLWDRPAAKEIGDWSSAAAVGDTMEFIVRGRPFEYGRNAGECRMHIWRIDVIDACDVDGDDRVSACANLPDGFHC